MHFINEVIAWYKQNKRDLPWRNTRDPYIIWLSEIILQQTRVEQGMPYFYRFAEKYPTVTDFASAHEDEILNLWQGLGYYSRGRNMHKTARIVMEEHAGYFPKKYDELIRLKGVGEYTAAAISSFAANEPRAVVDGNVFRLLARYFGIEEVINSSKGKKAFTVLANEVIDKANPGLSNQAMMEFGSLQCRPQNPDCPACPLRPGCFAYKNQLAGVLPVKQKKTVTRNRYFNYIVAVNGDRILLNKRGQGDIWHNLHEFPLFETPEPLAAEDLVAGNDFKELFGKTVKIQSVYGPVKHVLSHQKLHARFIVISNFEEAFKETKNWFYVNFDQLEALAQPKLIFAFLKMFPTLNNDLLISKNSCQA